MFGYVIVPLVSLNTKFPLVFACGFTVTVTVFSAFIYPSFVALIDIEYVFASVTCGIVLLYSPFPRAYSIVAPAGFVVTLIIAS